MLKNYLLLALRVLRRNKLYSIISIGCLSIGIAVCMTIMLYVLHEQSFEKWQANSRRIFSAGATMKFGDGSYHADLLSYSTAPVVMQAMPEVEGFLRVSPAFQPMNFRNPAKPEIAFTEKNNFVYADSNFYRFFSLRLEQGDPDRVLARPYTLVLTRRAARKYFGTQDPVGRVLRLNGKYNFEVTGVAADPPSNTDLQYDFIASTSSMATMEDERDYLQSAGIQTGAFFTWFLLRNPSAAHPVERAMDKRSVRPVHPDKDKDGYSLTPLTDMHLNPDFGGGSNQTYLKIFPLVASLILLLALVNYMSLATARSTARAKEVGVRKVMGAARVRIASQFYTESALFALLAFGLGIGLFLLCRGYFLRVLQLQIDSSFLLSPTVLGGAGLLLAMVILLAGSYPALVLSAFKPVAVLYGKLSRRRGEERVRKGFVVFQFVISMTLVLCSVIIEKELHYFRHIDTGVDRENVIMIPFGPQLGHYTAFKREVESLPGIRQVSTSHYPLYGGSDGLSATPPGSEKAVEVSAIMIDDQFVPMLGLRWLKPPVDNVELHDGKHLVLNETAVEKLGLSGDPMGQHIKIGNNPVTVAGVIKDFNYEALQQPIKPLFLSFSSDTASEWGGGANGYLLAKIQPHTNLPTLVKAIQTIYGRYEKQTAFEYDFADDAFDARYKAEDRLADMFGLFTTITILIACLGLFALATFSAQQRMKEIGIRKVLGASVGSIGVLLSRDFMRPVLLAILIACPLSCWLMNKWLEDFAYRTELSWWIFVAAGLGLLLLALGTVLSRSLRAARVNPVENLRAE
jgi:putative ABC transport system permease protein